MVTLTFCAGTLELSGLPSDAALPTCCRWDQRSGTHRAPASAYAELVRALTRAKVPFADHARAYEQLDVSLRLERVAHPFQAEALRAWTHAGSRGVVVLPTGSGKSHLAVMAICARRRSTLVVAPTLDLVSQWYSLLYASFGVPIGVVGGGEYDVRPLTVATYDSAYLHMDDMGAKFGVLVFDECHHLPSASYALAAELCLAPYRLGLTATYERADGRERTLDSLVGPVVYQKNIVELSGEYLAEYETVRLHVELGAEEREQYASERAIYLAFLREHGIRMADPRGWKDFIIRASRSDAGRRALRAYRRQRDLALSAPAKLEALEGLLGLHREDRTLVFTQDNATAYGISRRFLVPAITHQTKVRERSEILERFSRGEYRVVVTSKVLNEGVDVPEANVAIVISGSGSVREHVQRLGRILRRSADKRAILYELVSKGTSETATSERRREHAAYRRGS
ncbi:MAG: DEAD/DEAH box helicase family protein [Polyangiaceae bacterium]|nr:DEAD/DEAH box helicase family protein [Polyangiaceae bacterium]